MTDSTPYYINELRSDLRGVKEGWYAIDEGGNLLFGPFDVLNPHHLRELC